MSPTISSRARGALAVAIGAAALLALAPAAGATHCVSGGQNLEPRQFVECMKLDPAKREPPSPPEAGVKPPHVPDKSKPDMVKAVRWQVAFVGVSAKRRFLGSPARRGP